MFSDNPDLYPTPRDLIIKMWHKIPKKDRYAAGYILEPSAGAGNIVEFIKDDFRYSGSPKIHAIEKDPRLVAMLRGKNIVVIDQDFLTYCGPDKYDIIIGNPPFSNGEYHLLKAIDIMYSGHIVFLLNAETIKNPHTNYRKTLVRKLTTLNADIEYLTAPFATAERKTDIEVALIHIHIDKHVEDDLFTGTTDAAAPKVAQVEGSKELTEKDSIRNIVADFNRTVAIGTQALIEYYKNHHHIGRYLSLVVIDEDERKPDDLTGMLKASLNQFLVKVRRVYWQNLLQFGKISKKLTVKKRKEFHVLLQKNEMMDFTESNIQTFIVNLAKSYDEILTEATVDVFDAMTVKHAWDEDVHFGNVHYFDGWKTNKAFFVNQKVVIPFWGASFFDPSWGSGRWSVSYNVKDQLNDIDKVMNSFDGAAEYVSIVDALEAGFKAEQTRKIKSTYFEITVFKKGTIHLTFLSEDIRRRFNITACKGKNWLPQDYGRKAYADMTEEEQKIVKQFEDEKIYSANVNPSNRLFRSKPSLQIEYEPQAEESQAA